MGAGSPGVGREGKARQRRRESIRRRSTARCALFTAATGMFPGISRGRAAPREATESHSPPARGLFFAAWIWQEKSCAASPGACPAASLCCAQPWRISPAQAASWTRGEELHAGLMGLKQSSASRVRSAPAILPGKKDRVLLQREQGAGSQSWVLVL